MCNRFKEGGGVSTLRLLPLVLLAVLLVLPLGLHAQASPGVILGTVTDQTGAAVPGATVTIINNGTNQTTTVKSDGQGNFSAPQLAVGTYDVHVTQGNFKEYIQTGVEVHTASTTTVNAVLQVGGASEKVTVSAQAIQVQTTSAAVGEVVSGTQVRELPLNGENFVGLTQLSPGVSAAQGANFEGKGLDGGVNFSVNGNPYNMNLFLVDGVNNNDVGSNRTILVYPSVDTIAEFKMIRNSYGPEYGQAAGAIISITTRSGQNQFHGGFFYSGRNAALDANDWYSNYNHTGKAAEIRNDWGYNISGPAIKDKLFFWWNQEWNREIQGSSFASCIPTSAEANGDFSAFTGQTSDQCGATVPTIPVSAQAVGNPLKIANPDAAGLLIAKFFPAPTSSTLTNGSNWSSGVSNYLKWSEWNVRADYDITSKHRATFRWTNDSWDNPSPNNPTAFWGESAFPTVQSTWSQPSRSVMAKLNSQISNSMVNDVEFGFGQNRIITTLGGTEASIVPALQSAYPAAWPASLKQKDEFFGQWGGFSPYGSYGSYASFWNIAPYGNHEDLYTLQDNLSKVHGNHTFKTGIFLSWNEKVESNGNGADRPSLPGPDAGIHPCLSACPGSLGSIDPHAETGNGLADALLPGTGTNPQMFAGVGENTIDGIADVHWHDIEPYFGDTWKIKRNLTIDFGFRWSFLREPYGGTNGGNTNPAYNSGGNYPNQWANWVASAYNPAEGVANPSDACNGTLIVPGTSPCATQKAFLAGLGVSLPLSNGTPGPNSALVQQNNHSIAPRVGIAWDVHGDGKMAVRAGGGQFFAREEVGLAEGLARNAPFVINATTNRALDAAPILSSPAVSPNYTKVTNGYLPNSWQWNVSVEQELARNTTLQIGYVGNTGIHLTSNYDANYIPDTNWLAASFQSGSGLNALRPAGNFGQIGGFARGGHATYNSLQVLFRSQTGPSTFQAAYTWGHSVGNVQLDNSSGGFNNQAITDIYNPALDKGNTNINRPNIFVANEVLYLPKLEQHSQLMQQTLGGWQINGIFTAAEGSSQSVFTTSLGSTAANSDGTSLQSLVGTGYTLNLRPLTVPDTSCNTGRHGNLFINPAHFTLVGYQIGTFNGPIAPRGDCFGAGNVNWDNQLAKNWYIKEKYRIKFAMDFFNFLNHPNFNTSNLESAGYTPSKAPLCGAAQTPCSQANNVISYAPGPTTGFAAAGTVYPGRTLQYSLKFSF